MTSDPADPDFWTAPGISVWLNPRVRFDTEGLPEFIREAMGIDSAIVLATSGTTGSGPKFVVLQKSAILASAASVNTQLEISESDRWLAALTLFHVGGVGIYARAALSNSDVVTVADPLKWDRTGTDFVNAIEKNGVTLSALTPVHLSDLVNQNKTAPASLRGILIGGGALSEKVASRALELGWPIWPTYGMTETCSQIATSTDPGSALSGWLPVLPGWQVRHSILPDADDSTLLSQRLDPVESSNEVISVNGDGLFSGYVSRDEFGNWNVEQPFDEDGWFETGDRVALRNENTELKFLGRKDELVKSLGELVSIRKLENTIAGVGIVGVVFPIPDERRENRFLAVIEDADSISLEIINSRLAPFERISEIINLDKLPRTAVGKIAKGELRKTLDLKD